LAERMLDGEINRQNKAQGRIAREPQATTWLEEKHLFQNYKQLQFFDTLALYFNRVHPDERAEQTFEHVPLNAGEDMSITIRPRDRGVYEMSPYPFRCQFRRICLRRPLHRAAAGTRRLVGGAQGNTDGVGKLSSGCG
jgi:hypothetical protein